MEELIKVLQDFVKMPHQTEDDLNEAFLKLAEYILYDGYFLVEEDKRIYLEDIEFYFHQEGESGIKDPIMYHTNDHEGRELPYYQVGRLNLHQSGVDVTFENPNEHYRASFLIRGFRVNKGLRDKRSTYIYDKMLYMGVPLDRTIEIKWVEDVYNGDKKITTAPRKNVPAVSEYKLENGKYKKDPKNPDLLHYDPKAYFRSSGKTYEQCQRHWRFIKDDKK